MVLYSKIDIPPKAAVGIVEISAVNFPKKEMVMAMTVACWITLVEATRVIPTTPVFSP